MSWFASSDVLFFVAFLVVWWVVSAFVMPKLGIQT